MIPRDDVTSITCIGNHVVSSAIWNKWAGINFFQRPTKLREPVGLVQFVVFEQINECLFISKLHEKNHVITY